MPGGRKDHNPKHPTDRRYNELKNLKNLYRTIIKKAEEEHWKEVCRAIKPNDRKGFQIFKKLQKKRNTIADVTWNERREGVDKENTRSLFQKK